MPIILKECPNQNWRTLLALARIGGVRPCSETNLLRRQGINWFEKIIFIRSPKTKRIEGHDNRIFPLFPELEHELVCQYDKAETGAPFVLERLGNRFNFRANKKVAGNHYLQILDSFYDD